MEQSMDPLVLIPNATKPMLDNARARVFEARMAPGDKTPWHTHPDHIIYFITDVDLHIALPEGKSEHVAQRAGDVVWEEGGEHEVANVGKAEARMLIVELKPA